MKPYKISAHSDNYYFHFFYHLSDWVEILWGFMKFFFKQMLKISALCLKKQKSFIPKKIFFRPLLKEVCNGGVSTPSITKFLTVVNIKRKNLCLLNQFSVKVLKSTTTSSSYFGKSFADHSDLGLNIPFGNWIINSRSILFRLQRSFANSNPFWEISFC